MITILLITEDDEPALYRISDKTYADLRHVLAGETALPVSRAMLASAITIATRSDEHAPDTGACLCANYRPAGLGTPFSLCRNCGHALHETRKFCGALK